MHSKNAYCTRTHKKEVSWRSFSLPEAHSRVSSSIMQTITVNPVASSRTYIALLCCLTLQTHTHTHTHTQTDVRMHDDQGEATLSLLSFFLFWHLLAWSIFHSSFSSSSSSSTSTGSMYFCLFFHPCRHIFLKWVLFALTINDMCNTVQSKQRG